MQVPVLGARAGAGAGARLPAGGVVHARSVPRAAAPAACARGRRRARRAVRRLIAVVTGKQRHLAVDCKLVAFKLFASTSSINNVNQSK